VGSKVMEKNHFHALSLRLDLGSTS
jgi:hypothetical protein